MQTLNCNGTLLSLSSPIIMGILNLTPDSFSDGGQFNTEKKALLHVEKMLSEGANIIDIGGYSSRPGATDISIAEELERVYTITKSILSHFPQAILSVDTFRSQVAIPLLDAGIHILNDISAGEADVYMMETVSKYQVPYSMMHMQGTPQTMQQNPQYEDVVETVSQYFVTKIAQAKNAGIKDLIIDPGFGFGKTLAHNYQLFMHIADFQVFDVPILIGVSRKSMIYKLIDTTPDDILPLTSALHLQALMAGAKILRVHDVKEAARIVKIYKEMCKFAG